MIRVQQLQLRPTPRLAVGLPVTFAAVAVPTLVQMSLANVMSDTTFPAYYPFILATAVFLHWRYAMAATALSALVANYLFMGRSSDLFATSGDIAGTILFLVSASATIFTVKVMRAGGVVAALPAPLRQAARKPLPKGHGLLLALVLSLGLWAGLIVGAVRLAF